VKKGLWEKPHSEGWTIKQSPARDWRTFNRGKKILRFKRTKRLNNMLLSQPSSRRGEDYRKVEGEGYLSGSNYKGKAANYSQGPGTRKLPTEGN